MKLAVAPLSTNARSSTLPLKVYKSNGIVTELNLLMYIFRRRKTLTKAASLGPFKILCEVDEFLFFGLGPVFKEVVDPFYPSDGF